MKALFAADILYHNKCLRIRTEDIFHNANNLDKEDRSKDETVLQFFKNVLSSFDIENFVSFVRDEMNKQLTDAEVINRTVKNLLHNYDGLCFTYMKIKGIHKCFFLPDYQQN